MPNISNSISESQSHKVSDQVVDKLPEFDGEPYVRYGFPKDSDNPKQEPRLRQISDPAPEGANTADGIYFLSDEQIQRNETTKDPWARENNVAYDIQEECEEVGRVIYPLYAESDDEDASWYEQREALKRFVREYLDVDPLEGTVAYSGNRSIHLHLPYYLTNEDALDDVKEMAKEFNDESDVTLDPEIYSTKRQFRLFGVKHEERGIPKFEVPIAGSEDELDSEMAQAVQEKEEREISYIAGSLGREFEPLEFGNRENTPLKKNIPTPLIEQEVKPENEASLKRWKQYNRHPFSPYANAGDQRRSIVVAQVKGNPFCREVEDDKRTLVPAYIYGAVGADGEYTIWRENAPLKLSPQDYRKWSFERGDVIALIGGQSRSSRILTLDSTLERETVVGALLADSKWDSTEEDGRLKALEMLESHGYDVGSAGKNGTRKSTSGYSQRSRSRAERLQRRAEQRGVQSLSHQERLDVANRLLKVRGWEDAIEWYRTQFGEDFKEDLTQRHLSSVTTKYDDLPSPP